MNDNFILSPTAGRRLALAVVLGLGGFSVAQADRDGYGGRHDRGPLVRRAVASPHPAHWVLDNRFNHNHYYPARGLAVDVLPPGYINIGIRGGHLFFSAGIWYRPEGRRYIVVAPPPGIFIPMLPPDYTTIWIGPTPYYYANEVYYTSAPNGGFTVVGPPPGYDAAVTQPNVQPSLPDSYSMPPPPPSTAGDTLFVYPKNGQSAEQTAKDRADCTRWAGGQTAYDPSRDSPDDSRRTDFQRAEGACLEGRGYTAK